MDSFRQAYKKTAKSFGGFDGAFTSNEFVSAVQDTIDETIRNLKTTTAQYKNCEDGLKGYLFEDWHGGAFNIDVARSGKEGISAIVPKVTSGPYVKIDVIIMKPDGAHLGAQLKCFDNAHSIAKEIIRPDYKGLQLIIPSEHLENVRAILETWLNHPDYTVQAADALQRINDRIQAMGNSSIPITDEMMQQMAEDLRKGTLDPEKYGLSSNTIIKWTDIARESAEAALNAALLTALLKAAPHLWETMSLLVKEGSIDPDALKKAGIAAISGATDGALRGSLAAAITASCKSGLLGQPLKNISPSTIAAGTVVAINAIQNAIDLYHGKMSQAEFAEACIRDSVIVSIGIAGASIGQVFITVPILGALMGNFIGSICGTIIYEGSRQIFFSFFIDSGVSFLTIVKQDYTVPKEVLRQAGFDLIELNELSLKRLELNTLQLNRLDVNTIDITVLKRGLISVNCIGYTKA